MKISKVSKFSILLRYVQNRKLGNLGKFSFTSDFCSSCNLRFKTTTNELSQKLKRLLAKQNYFCHNLALNV